MGSSVSLSNRAVYVGLGMAGLVTTTILTTANKLSRLGQLTLGGSSLACLGFGLLSSGVAKKEPILPSTVIGELTYSMLPTQPGMLFFKTRFKLAKGEQEREVTGEQIASDYGFGVAMQLGQTFKFSGKVFADVDVNTAMNALQDYAEDKEDTLIYRFKNDKGQMISVDLFSFGEVANLLSQLDEKSKQVLTNDIKTIVDWKSDPQGPKRRVVNGKIFFPVENGIFGAEFPLGAQMEFVTTAIAP